MSDLVLIYCEPGCRLATVLCPECGRISKQPLLTAYFSNRVTELIKPHTCPICKVVYKKCDPSQSDNWSTLSARYYSDPETYNQTVMESYPNKSSLQVSLLSFLTEQLQKRVKTQTDYCWICTVSFRGILKYDQFISDSGELRPGTEVVVTDNRLKVGTVRDCQAYTAKNAPQPLDKMKHIISVQMEENPIYDLVPSHAEDIETASLTENIESVSLGDNKEARSLVIKEHDFHKAISSLKQYVTKSNEELSLLHVPTFGGLFGLGDHKVTGSELNTVTSQVQNNLIDINELTRDLVGEFRHVYEAFESLDRDYIAGILSSIESAKEVSADEKKDRKRIDENVKRINVNTKQINKSIQVLQKFKGDIDKLKHIFDVDKAWDLIKKQQQICDSLTASNERLSGIMHLMDVDAIWQDADLLKEEASELRDSIEETKTALSELQNAQEDYEARVSEAISDYCNSFNQKLYEQSDAIKLHKDDIDSALSKTSSDLTLQIQMLSEQNQLQLADVQKEFSLSLANLSEEQASTVNKVQDLQASIAAQEQLLQESEKRFKEEFSDLDSSMDQRLHEQADTIKQHKDDIDSALSKTSSDLTLQIQMLAEQNQQQLADAQKAHAETLAHFAEEQFSAFDSIQKTQEERFGAFTSDQEKQMVVIANTIETEKASLQDTVSLLKRKLKTAYILAGSAAALAFTGFILNLLGVL